MKWIYYILIKPMSLLPLAVTYRLSDVLSLLIQYVFRYRLSVVQDNISTTLTHLDAAAQRRIIRTFYRHFTDLIFESIRLFSMPERELRRRIKMINPSVIDDYYAKGQSVIAVGGHYGNWEMFAVSTNLLLAHQVIGIYTSLSNAFMDHKLRSSRSRYGVHLAAKKEVKEYFANPLHDTYGVFFGADQSPSKGKKAFKTDFLGRKTRVQFGVEKYAVGHNLPVIFFELRRVGRGKYEVTFDDLCSNPAATNYGDITLLHVHRLEQQILREPGYWLWSHRRWKGM